MREQAGGCSFLLEEDPERPTHFLCLGSEKIKVALGKSEKYERGKKKSLLRFLLSPSLILLFVSYFKTNVALSTL